MNEGIIYKYTSPSDKVYIGQTTQEAVRMRQFRCITASYGGKAINNARAKYGPDSFQYVVLENLVADDKEALQVLLNKRESYYITLYKSNNPKYGYNETAGGQNAANYGMLGKQHTQETKDKIAELNRNNPQCLQRCKDNGMMKAIEVDVFTKAGEYIETLESISEAARKYNGNKANIAKCAANHPKYKSVKGFIFRKHNYD